MSRFSIDFFELAFLAEACIPPVPIARGSFWMKLVDVYYKDFTPEERTRLYEWMVNSERFKNGLAKQNKDCGLFEARFNPENQYEIEAMNCNLYDCFLWNGEYYVDSKKFIPQCNIITIREK